MQSDILQPVAVLAAWTMVMWLWMYATRLPAIGKLPKDATPGADIGWSGAKLDAVLPPQIQWKAHNYNHLHEAPTIFYAVALVLAITGQGDGANAILAWIYVALRVLHSLWQSLVNKVLPRFAIFLASSVVLGVLVLRCAISVLI